jgi:hypothetical protein
MVYPNQKCIDVVPSHDTPECEAFSMAVCRSLRHSRNVCDMKNHLRTPMELPTSVRYGRPPSIVMPSHSNAKWIAASQNIDVRCPAGALMVSLFRLGSHCAKDVIKPFRNETVPRNGQPPCDESVVESAGTIGLLSGSHCPIGEFGETVRERESVDRCTEKVRRIPRGAGADRAPSHIVPANPHLQYPRVPDGPLNRARLSPRRRLFQPRR